MTQRPHQPMAAVIALWAASAQYPLPQFVAAWAPGLDAAASWREEHEGRWRDFATDQRGDGADFGDGGPWRFWTEHAYLHAPKGGQSDA